MIWFVKKIQKLAVNTMTIVDGLISVNVILKW